MHLPKTPETAGLIGKEALAKTKPGVIIVNAARGGLIDEQALADAIASGHVRGAGLDVFSTEPCTDSPLFDLPQVVVTPHLGASTAEAQDRAGTDVAASVNSHWPGSSCPTRSTSAEASSARRSRRGWTWCASWGCWSVCCPPSCLPRCRYRSAASWHPKRLGCCVFPRCEDCSRGHRGPGDVRERAGAGRRAWCRGRISTASESPNHRSVVDVRAIYADGSVVNVAGTLSGPQLVEKIVQINGRNFDLRAEGCT